MPNSKLYDPTEVRQGALLEEMQKQRGFLGDRAVNLAAELAAKSAELEMALARIAALEKECQEWKANQPELPLET